MRLTLLFLAILMASVVYRASLDTIIVAPAIAGPVVMMTGTTIVGDVEPIQPTHDITHLDYVEVIWYDTKAELNQVYQRGCLNQIQECEKSVLAFTRVVPEDFACEIHALKPVNVDAGRMDILGHEFAHCLFGSFHD